ncbi:hypothetical protein CLOP_g64 [Closterium sp. NIES-67]|nr:hypothetical protein CLOP_g64 [Closterium sp. NIES-67]
MAAAVLHVSSPGSGTPRQSCEERQSCEGDESPASTGEQSPATTGEATTGEESPVTATPASHAQALPSDWRARIQASDASSFTGSEGERLPARAVPGDCLARIQASDASSFTGSEGERLPAQALPSDCLASIFSHLTDVRDVARAGATCRSWWRCYSDVVRKSVSCLSLAPNPLSLEWEPLYSRPLFPPPPLVNQPLFRDSLVRQPLLRQLCLQNVRPDSTNQLLNLTGLTAQGESAGLFMDDGQGSAGSSINGRDLRCCLEDLQRSPSLRPRVDEAMAAYIGASATLPLLSGESCLNSRTSRSLALSSLQDVLRLDTPPSTISWPLHRVASMLRSFPLLASLHLPFLSHIGAGSTQDGIEPECHYIDAVCRLVASCCPSLRHCHIQFGRRLQGGRTSQHPLLVTGTNSRSQPRTVTPFVNQEFADPNDIHSSLAEIITDSDNNPHSNPPSNPHLGLAWLFHKCPSLVSLHLISSSASPACLDLSPSLIPLFSRLTRLSLSLKTIPPSLLPSLTALNSLTLHVSDPACPVTCSSAPFTRLSLLSHLELRLGPNWATAYPVPRLFQDMFSGLQASLTSLSLTLPFVAHLPVSLWELTSLRSLCIINPAFHPGVQRPEYMSGVSGLRHLTCLQLLGHTVPGLVMGALGGIIRRKGTSGTTRESRCSGILSRG